MSHAGIGRQQNPSQNLNLRGIYIIPVNEVMSLHTLIEDEYIDVEFADVVPICRDKCRRNRRRESKRLAFERRKNIVENASGYDPWRGWLSPSGNYIKYMHSSCYRKYLQRRSNKKVRHKKYELFNGCSYKKVYDLWWELF